TILQVPRPGPSLLPTRRRRLAAHLPAVNQPQEFLHRPLELLIPAAVHSAGLVAHQDVRLRLPVLEETAGRCILDAPGRYAEAEPVVELVAPAERARPGDGHTDQRTDPHRLVRPGEAVAVGIVPLGRERHGRPRPAEVRLVAAAPVVRGVVEE